MADLLSSKTDQLLGDVPDSERGDVMENHSISGSRDSIRDKIRSYVRSSDFTELLGCAAFVAATIVLKNLRLDPRQRKIPYQYLQSTGDYVVNQVNNEQYVGETVTGNTLYIVAVFIPVVLQLFLCRNGGQKDMHKTGCVYLTAVGLTLFLTDLLKIYVGYLRPIFFSKCQPNENYESCSIDNDRGIRVSFPSGHSSLVFCGMLLVSLYMERRFGASSVRSMRVDSISGRVMMEHTSKPGLYRLVSLFCYTPMLIALFVASSRVADNMHFPADVVGGSLLGGSIAALVHGIWFPTLPIMEDDC